MFLLRGFIQCTYFPISLLHIFINVVLYGEVLVTEEELMTDLLRFVSIDEADTICACLFENVACDRNKIIQILFLCGTHQR